MEDSYYDIAERGAAQGQNAASDAEEPPVQGELEATAEGGEGARDAPSVQPSEPTMISDFAYDKLGEGVEMEVASGTFSIMQTRMKMTPNSRNVKSIQDGIGRKSVTARVLVYEDIDTGERFSVGGTDMNAAFKGLGLNVPIILYRVKDAKKRADLETCRANSSNPVQRSPADQQFQMEKACSIFLREHNTAPSPANSAR